MITGNLMITDDDLYFASSEGRAFTARLVAEAAAKAAEPAKAIEPVKKSDKSDAERLKREVIKPKDQNDARLVGLKQGKQSATNLGPP